MDPYAAFPFGVNPQLAGLYDKQELKLHQDWIKLQQLQMLSYLNPLGIGLSTDSGGSSWYDDMIKKLKKESKKKGDDDDDDDDKKIEKTEVSRYVLLAKQEIPSINMKTF